VLTYIPIRTLLMIAFGGLLLTIPAVHAGTTDDTFKESGELRKRTSRTSDDIDDYVKQLDKTERALSAVSEADSGDLRKRYKSFSKEVQKLEEAQERATSDIGKMRSTDAEYFTSWAKSNTQIADPVLREASATRRFRIMKLHDALADAMSDIGLQLQPFMSNLHDLRTFLGADVSPTNVSKAGDMIAASQAEAQVLKDRIAIVQVLLKQFLNETPE